MNQGPDSFLLSVADDLEEVDKELARIFKNPLLKQIASLPAWDKNISPGIVLLTANLFGKSRSAVLPAVFIKLIDLATRMHNLLLAEGKEEERIRVLAGDYVYAHLFFSICQKGCFSLLERISRLIITINEGFALQEVAQQKTHARSGFKLLLAGIERRFGNFFGEACALSGLFAGIGEKEQKLLYKFGKSFGIAYGITEMCLEKELAQPHLDQSLGFLSEIETSVSKEDLSKLVSLLIFTSGQNESYA